MEMFKIEIQEILSKTINIQAQNIEEALEKVNQMYRTAPSPPRPAWTETLAVSTNIQTHYTKNTSDLTR